MSKAKSQDKHETSCLTVALAERSYDIHLGSGLLKNAGEILRHVMPLPRCIIITDSNVAGLHLKALEEALKKVECVYHTITIAAGESSKSFEVLESVMDAMLAFKPERNVTLIALGGGVVGDLTGFAASILLRGVPFIQIPTSLLAQVDSAVGGKTGINSSYGKNLIGSFYQPRAVIADMEVLDTLPEREFLAGYAEIVKYGLINRPDFFAWLKANAKGIKARDKALLKEAVYICCQAKAEIVTQDEKEKGQRALLNLGHTFGHALEAEMGYDGRLLHGEAVSVGMVLAFRMSEQLGLCKNGASTEVESHLKAMGLPTRLTDIQDKERWDIERLIMHMHSDKKVQAGKLVFILAKSIGEAILYDSVSHDDIALCLNRILMHDK